jgi:hypothetical protein
VAARLRSPCFTLSKLRAPAPIFGDADGLDAEPRGVTGSLVAGVVPDGPNAIDVYRGRRRVGTARVHNNVAVFHSTLGAPAAAHLRLVYVQRRAVRPRLAARRAALLGQAQRSHHTVAAAILRDFPFFAAHGSLGRLDDVGQIVTVSRPPLSSLPTGILSRATERAPYDP